MYNLQKWRTSSISEGKQVEGTQIPDDFGFEYRKGAFSETNSAN